MGSQRFPGKVAAELDGWPILVHCIRRLQRIRASIPVIAATSGLEQDDAVVRIACGENVDVFRGSEQDVLDRYYQAACKYKADYIVRATADNPFVDPEEGCRVVEAIQSGDYDYVCGFECVDYRKLPIGVGLEAFTFKSLERSWFEGHQPNHREHVNEYIQERPGAFRIHFLPCRVENDCPDLSLTVDTPADLEFVKTMIAESGKSALELKTKELIRLWRQQAVTL